MACCLQLFKSKSRPSTYLVDGLLDDLRVSRIWLRTMRENSTDPFQQIPVLEEELRILRMFVMYTGKWSDADKQVGYGQELGCLVRDLEAAFKEARNDFIVAAKERVHPQTRKKNFEAAISKLREKLTLFRPQLQAAHEYIASNHSFQSHHPLSNYDDWYGFISCLRHILKDLLGEKGKLPRDIYLHLRAMSTLLNSVHCFVFGMNGCCPSLEKDLRTHFGAFLVCIANFFYSYWHDMKDEDKSQEVIVKLSDLLKAFSRITPEVMDLCHKLLDAYCYSHSWLTNYDAAQIFVNFLIPIKLETIKTVERLIVFVFYIDRPDLHAEGDIKLLSLDIIASSSELRSYCYSFQMTKTTERSIKVTHPTLFRLLEKLELLNAEVFLIELLNHGIRLEDLESIIDSFHQGLTYLQTYYKDVSQVNAKFPKTIWLHIPHLVREAGSVYQSFRARLITQDELKTKLLKLIEKITLLKTEILLEELLDGHPNLIVDVKNQMESLDEGLMVLRTYLMGPLEEDEKLILTQAESVARDAASFYYSLLVNEISEDTVRKFSHLLPELVEKVKVVNAEIQEMYTPVRMSSRSHLTQMEGFGFINFLLRDLKEQLGSEAEFIISMKHQIHAVHAEIESLRSFLREIEELYMEYQELKSVVPSIVQVILEVEYLNELFVLEKCLRWYHPLWLLDLVEDLKLTNIQASEILKSINGTGIYNFPKSSGKVISPAKIPKIDEIVIDLADQKKLMIDRLLAGSSMLDVVSIVGMAGLGKTTLVWKLYTDPLVTYHFHVRAWCSVSQAYRKRELLLQILGDIVELTDHILEMSDVDLETKLYQCLKRNKYLIVMDDIWSTQAWQDFERICPNDNNGSRILITSRLPDVATKIKEDSTPHPLRLLSDDESWKLLQKKLFDTKECPDELMALGKEIAKGCKGLPLAVVAISGLLERTDMIPGWWKQVSDSICSHIADDAESRCMDILELSYRYLPDHLKHCFLYTGVFLEDKDIPVRKLTWLWIAEGFVPSTGPESIDDVAEGCLKDLIGRSLLMVYQRRPCGRVKMCRVHDMLRTLCMRKSEKENFLQCKNGFDELFGSSHEDLDYGVDPNYFRPTNSITYKNRRLSICSKRNHFIMSRPSGPHVHSLLYFATSDSYPRCPYDISFIFDNFTLLRVLDLECINLGHSFPTEVQLSVHLRYLALCGDIDSIPASIYCLRDLETLVVKGLKGKVLLPCTLWSMKKLRHVQVNNHAAFSLQDGESTFSPEALNLISLSCPHLLCDEATEDIMRRLLNLRKLRCLFSALADDTGKRNQFPRLNFLKKLESLNVLYSGASALPCKFDFPSNLKKLTISKFRLPWDCVSEIGRLPNLEILKLLSRAFEGKVWEMKEGEFLKLKFLKLDSLNLAEWNASCDHLPQLQHLILRSCRQLEEVPLDFGDSSTLEMIEVQFCPPSVEKSVRCIQEAQHDLGNELKVLIDRSDMDF